MTTSFNRRQILARATATGAIGALGTSFATSAWAQAAAAGTAARSAPPKAPKHKAVGWMNGTGGVTTHNPAQSRMEIRDAGDGRRELRTAE